MFSYLKGISCRRGAWLLLVTSCAAIEGAALYFQHGMGLEPCAMCIYERVALFGILAAGVLGFLSPSTSIIRWLALGIGLFSAVKGTTLAMAHASYQLHPSPRNRCSPFVDFPDTLPLNQWFPNIFEAKSLDCAKIVWQFWDLTMPQWLIAIFGFYIALFTLLILSQFVRNKSASRSLFK